MNDAVKGMLDRYNCSSVNDYENALKEIIQEIALLGLWRSKFFEKAAFYGGSALRILYGLDRFSEDLDFSLLKNDESFLLTDYCRAVEDELKSFGFSVVVEMKDKKFETNIDSAFIKAGTLKNMIIIDIPESVRKKIHSGKVMKIKLEVDTEPPGAFRTEARYLFQPVPFSVNTYTLPHLFAGKMHAVLCRSWGKRVKGRDWYDLVWYVGRDLSVGLKHLENRMKQTGHLEVNESLTEEILKQRLQERIGSTDFNNAKKDVENLLKDPSSLELWSEEFFKVICEKIKTIQ
ncbi:MAG: nucleotidyl transferase AbiEii/AbiGii toxin family protein [Deltaproteobacteria bacterium]|nr:nucleotidyl transferase AbiEii/AbiGii toxin family protein [Deltaproteobacteria bacterium]MBW1910526.1 nucleotidyl transferase AbiEii/AbiGii toxin family protein [Deltaproteobacteria bacterium]MBW2034079.1 nucleotidyl transferase AbiEii/AbiGii toxin family protein [Deltaproteobacteria bacterium]MBW2114582.1 nucleotidyl transferase AbiEii/AbiGii toxin family protein [Deltaproteobacteria bacterium]MBW2358672.1 nucleotidyl transferase AbiEii/AbiGii toxin family protein [Deltaproteobacteria bact